MAEASNVSAGMSLRKLEALPTSTWACAVPASKVVKPKPALPNRFKKTRREDPSASVVEAAKGSDLFRFEKHRQHMLQS